MILYPMGIQIYNQVSILRSTSKVKLDHTILLGFGLKEQKITMNIVKVGVHTYHPNAHQKIWSNFNSKKFVKCETPSCGFAKVGVKGGQNSLEHYKKCKLLGLCLTKYEQIWILRNCSKVKLCRVVSLWLGLKEVKIIGRDIAKFGVDDFLSNGHPNL